jgi:multidrug efflux pump subunit AcrA (membrane-fusion protein)
LQLGGLIAERDKAAKLRDQYLATGETALAQIAQLDSQRFEAQLSQIREKQQHLAITSPIAGIVLSGDLKRAEGSPVNRGQILFEIAPLARMEVEISVPEREIALVTTELPVQIRFTAYPDTSWRGSIDQIVPKSQIRGNSNVFLARLQFDNAEGLLRPGMRGEAKIAAGWRPIGWQLFRKPWHTLRGLADQIF